MSRAIVVKARTNAVIFRIFVNIIKTHRRMEMRHAVDKFVDEVELHCCLFLLV